MIYNLQQSLHHSSLWGHFQHKEEAAMTGTCMNSTNHPQHYNYLTLLYHIVSYTI